MANKITWTEIAIQLTGEVPASCRLLLDGGMRVRLVSGHVTKFYKKEVDAARKELEANAKEEIPPAKPPAKPKAEQPAKRGPKPKAGAK